MFVDIQSVNDIITNSSSEVFLTDSKSKIELLDKAGIEYIKFDTEEDIKNYVLSEDNYYLAELDEIVERNPLGDYFFIKDLLKYHTEDEIWEFYKPFYLVLLGKAYVNVDRDYYYRQLEKVGR